ncbi:biotin carboxyl carrier domain-containing protein [Antarcticimicrobium luteum]|uniref:Biotin carboxyl carrier protein of acetyl-CoA carboxylase n=1 Tax=Antarcticimicrobium luteum TaxID=2547397 RepID=A0A4R5VD31_9RHOB|nr:biotin carboxyl carrier domain-containing protein [Antarcticimicrobium luteum]
MIKIEAAMPGLLYHKPEPDAEPFKKPGDPVAVGDTLALVELMKSFVPIEAEIAGTFRGFLIGDGESLDPGVPFCEIEA